MAAVAIIIASFAVLTSAAVMFVVGLKLANEIRKLRSVIEGANPAPLSIHDVLAAVDPHRHIGAARPQSSYFTTDPA
jgi:ABC-type spermidine/putrescine transport system permease subunit II